jgi:hypothetical protein
MILLESDDVTAALLECEDMEGLDVDLDAHVNCLQWREFLSTWKNKGIQGITLPADLRFCGKVREAPHVAPPSRRSEEESRPRRH